MKHSSRSADSRRDLPDIALLATARSIEAKRLRDALDLTFAFRGSHLLPAMLPQPLPAWRAPYAAMARENQLAWPTLDEVTDAAKAFLDPVLAGHLDATWNSARWTWIVYQGPSVAKSQAGSS